MPQPTNQSRREFLRNSAGAVAASAVAGSLLSVPQAYAAGADDSIKIALVGCGGRGTGAASQALSTKGSVRLIAVADAFEDNAKSGLQNLKQQFNEKVQVP